MKIIEGRVRLAASDVANFLACRRLTQEPRPDGVPYEVVDAKLARSAKARAALHTLNAPGRERHSKRAQKARAGACAPSDYWNWSSRFLFQVIMVQAP